MTLYHQLKQFLIDRLKEFHNFELASCRIDHRESHKVYDCAIFAFKSVGAYKVNT
jgi:hypothetical protein